MTKQELAELDRPVKKNCYNCKCLTEEYESDSDGYEIGGGYHCEKQYQKAYESGRDIEYEKNMCRKDYLQKGKVCFEPKEQPADIECPKCGAEIEIPAE